MQKFQAYSFKRFLPLCLFSLICSSFLFSHSTLAADLAGRIIMARGDVQAINEEGVMRQLKRRDSIYNHEIIKTGKDSKVQIRFIDNALLALKADSELNIKAYVYSTENEEDNQVLMELVTGGFRTLTGQIGKGNKAAYKVETPVASIGIRGTLYDVQLAVDKILAGVWKGGIALDTAQGQFNLGLNSDFDFGEISSSGAFTGLLTPPQAFTPPTPQTQTDSTTEDRNGGVTQGFSSDDNDAVATNEPSQLESFFTTNGSIPSPFEKEGRPDKSIAESNNFTRTDTNTDPTTPDPNDPDNETPSTSPDLRLTSAEMDQLLTENTLAILLGSNNQNITIALNTDGTGETFFLAPNIAEDGEKSYETIRRGNATEADFSDKQPWSDQVSWGIWQGDSENPIQRYTEFNNNQYFTPLEQDLFYMAAQPASSTELSAGIIVGTMNFSTSVMDLSTGHTDYIASSNVGNVTHIDAQFNLTSSSGNYSISNVSLNVDIGSEHRWNMHSTTGEINGAGISIENLTGSFITLPTDTSATASGTLNGLLLAPSTGSSDITTFAGGFELSTTDGVNNAAGVIILQTGQ